QNRINEYGNTYFYSGETRLNMLVKGPDAWGAKTGAFIEGDFRGASIGQTAGVFELRHAFMEFNWTQDQLLMGQTWNEWGALFSGPILGTLAFNELTDVMKGARQPQVRWTHKWNKNFSGFIGIYSEYNTTGNPGAASSTASAQNDSARSLMPHYMGEFKWRTDSCGKIGPWLTELALGGFYGQEKVTWLDTSGTRWTDEKVNTWMMALKGFIPIIPEKKGNKAGAFALSGAMFYGQLPTNTVYLNASANPYQTGATANGTRNIFTPVTYGGWGGLTYYFTDVVYVNGIYSTRSNNLPSYPKDQTIGNNAVVKTNQMYLVNIMWDVNPAIRLGLEYSRNMTGYGGYGADAVNGAVAAGNLDSQGKVDNVRIGAFYFF
ncbi:MAG: hypothetical protein NTX75_13985, partial [Proteobacteria bacterium]|nr:hypothetical protein [Pseudomonadota bacterium]